MNFFDLDCKYTYNFTELQQILVQISQNPNFFRAKFHKIQTFFRVKFHKIQTFLISHTSDEVGQHIGTINRNWEQYQVLRLNLNRKQYKKSVRLEKIPNSITSEWEIAIKE